MLVTSIVLCLVIIHKTRVLQCSSARQKARNRRLTLVIVFLLGLKLICWTPIVVSLVGRILRKKTNEDITKMGLSIVVVLDPMAYGLFMQKYRDVLKQVCGLKTSRYRAKSPRQSTIDQTESESRISSASIKAAQCRNHEEKKEDKSLT